MLSSRAQRWTGLSDREVFAERARGLPWSSSRWALPGTVFAPKLVGALVASILCLLSLSQAGKESRFIFAFLAYGTVAALLFWIALKPASYARLTARQAAGNYAFFAAQGQVVRQVDMLLPCHLSGRWRVALLGRPGEDRQSLLARSRAVAQHASWEEGPWRGLARLLREYGSTMGQPAPVLLDAAGNQFSVLYPGEFVALLPDGWVLGIAEQTQEAPQCTGYQVSVPTAGLGDYRRGRTVLDEEGVYVSSPGCAKYLAWSDVRGLRAKATTFTQDHYGAFSVSRFLVLDRYGRETPLPGYCGAGERVNERLFLSGPQLEFYLRWLTAVGERGEATQADEWRCRALPPRVLRRRELGSGREEGGD